jgi:hypothetical protein
MSSGGDGLVDGLYAILGILSGEAMLNDLDATKGTMYGQFICLLGNLSARCI